MSASGRNELADSPLIEAIATFEEMADGRDPQVAFWDEAFSRLNKVERKQFAGAVKVLRQLRMASAGSAPCEELQRIPAAACPIQADSDFPLKNMASYRMQFRMPNATAGTLYCAIGRRGKQRFAVRVFSLEQSADDNVRSLLTATISSASRLWHPNIGAVSAGIQMDRHFAIVSNWIEGLTLAEVLNHCSAPVPARDAAAIIRQVAVAMIHAHRRGAVHGRVRASNVILQESPLPSRKDESQLPAALVLVDFGVQGAADAICRINFSSTPPSANHSGRLPSELAHYESDVRQLGFLFFELLTLQKTEVVQILEPAWIQKNQPRMRHELSDAHVDAPIADLCMRSVMPGKRNRIRTAADFFAELERVVSKPTRSR